MERAEKRLMGILTVRQIWAAQAHSAMTFSIQPTPRIRSQESKFQSRGRRCCSVPQDGLGVPPLWGLPVRGSVTSVCSQAHSRQNLGKQPTWLQETQVPENNSSCVQGEFEELRSSPMEPQPDDPWVQPAGVTTHPPLSHARAAGRV